MWIRSIQELQIVGRNALMTKFARGLDEISLLDMNLCGCGRSIELVHVGRVLYVPYQLFNWYIPIIVQESLHISLH